MIMLLITMIRLRMTTGIDDIDDNLHDDDCDNDEFDAFDDN
jgi:hypothetical protein